jgi:hypothetical protein
VRVTAPPGGAAAQSNPVTFTVQFDPRANVSTFKATLDPTAYNPTMGGTDITSNFSQCGQA